MFLAAQDSDQFGKVRSPFLKMTGAMEECESVAFCFMAEKVLPSAIRCTCSSVRL